MVTATLSRSGDVDLHPLALLRGSFRELRAHRVLLAPALGVQEVEPGTEDRPGGAATSGQRGSQFLEGIDARRRGDAGVAEAWVWGGTTPNDDALRLVALIAVDVQDADAELFIISNPAGI